MCGCVCLSVCMYVSVGIYVRLCMGTVPVCRYVYCCTSDITLRLFMCLCVQVSVCVCIVLEILPGNSILEIPHIRYIHVVQNWKLKSRPEFKLFTTHQRIYR